MMILTACKFSCTRACAPARALGQVPSRWRQLSPCISENGSDVSHQLRELSLDFAKSFRVVTLRQSPHFIRQLVQPYRKGLHELWQFDLATPQEQIAVSAIPHRLSPLELFLHPADRIAVVGRVKT